MSDLGPKPAFFWDETTKTFRKAVVGEPGEYVWNNTTNSWEFGTVGAEYVYNHTTNSWEFGPGGQYVRNQATNAWDKVLSPGYGGPYYWDEATGSWLKNAASVDVAEAYARWDFLTNQAWFGGDYVGALANTPGWSFTRASAGYAQTSAGALVSFASGVPRITDKGILIEGARTNLFLNSATGATQNVTVAAVAHTLSFRGTGTITLSGTSTAGPLVGTGASDRVTLTFTPTAGTLTLTVSGSCTNVNLEAGAFASSWIETAGASAARAADVLTVPVSALTYPLSLFAEFERVVDTGGGEFLLQIDAGAATNRVVLSVESTDKLNIAVTSGGAGQGGVEPNVTLTVGSTVRKGASRTGTNTIQAALGGTLGSEDTTCTAPSTPTAVRFGSNSTGAGQPFGYLRRASIWPRALTDSELTTVTS